MTLEELDRSITELRARPLRLLCRTPRGKERVMTPEECHRSGSTYIHVIADDLDDLLSEALAAE